MSKEKTLRDEIAISMTNDTFPTINDKETLALLNDKYGLEWSDDDPLVQIEWTLKYQAIMRYMYADAMLAVR